MRSTRVPESRSPVCMTCRTAAPCVLEADPQDSGAARPFGAGGFLLVLALVVALLGLTGCDDNVEIKPPRPGADTSAQRAEEAQQSLEDLVRAIRGGSREDAVATAASGSDDLLGWV